LDTDVPVDSGGEISAVGLLGISVADNMTGSLDGGVPVFAALKLPPDRVISSSSSTALTARNLDANVVAVGSDWVVEGLGRVGISEADVVAFDSDGAVRGLGILDADVVVEFDVVGTFVL